MLSKKPPVPVAKDGVTTYAAPAAVVAESPAAFGVKVTLVTLSPEIAPEEEKLVALVPALKAVPYSLLGPVAVTVKAFLETVPLNAL